MSGGVKEFSRSAWNVMLLVLWVSAVIMIILTVAFQFKKSDVINQFNTGAEVEFVDLLNLERALQTFTGIVAALACIIAIGILEISPPIRRVNTTIKKALKYLVGFLIWVPCLWIAMSSVMYLCFGPYLVEFHTFPSSVFNLIAGLLHCKMSTRYYELAGTFIYVVFVIISLLIMFNMVNSILYASKRDTKAEPEADADWLALKTLFLCKRGTKGLTGIVEATRKLRKKKGRKG